MCHMLIYAHGKTFVHEGSGTSPQGLFKCLYPMPQSESKISGLEEHLTLPNSSLNLDSMIFYSYLSKTSRPHNLSPGMPWQESVLLDRCEERDRGRGHHLRFCEHSHQDPRCKGCRWCRWSRAGWCRRI